MSDISIEEIEKRIKDSYELPNNSARENMPNPLVTVRTSTYQHGPYIRDCIEGVLMQKTNFPFEFIIGEDFSTDGTREIVFEYARKYPDVIRVITADYNVGSKANGRRCASIARGKYIAICEGDDYWTDPFKLQKQFDFLENNPDFSLCFHRFYEKKNDELRLKPYHLKHELTLEDFAQSVGGIQTLTVLHRNIIPPITGTELPRKVKATGTYFLYARLAEFGKFKLIDEPMAVYRIHAGGIWSGKTKYEKALMAVNNREAITLYYKKNPSIYRLFKSTYVKNTLEHAGYFFQRYRIKTGLRFIALSFRFGITLDHLRYFFFAPQRKDNQKNDENAGGTAS